VFGSPSLAVVVYAGQAGGRAYQQPAGIYEMKLTHIAASSPQLVKKAANIC